MTHPLNLSFPSRRQFLVKSAVTTLSAAAVALLAGYPTLAAAKGATHGAAASGWTVAMAGPSSLALHWEDWARSVESDIRKSL